MTPYKKKSQIIDKREALSLIFKDILCSKSRSKYISPFLQNILNIPGNILLFQGNQSPNYIKLAY